MSNWKSTLLEDVAARWFRGSTPSRSHPEYYSEGEGIPWVRVGDLNQKIVETTEISLTQEGAGKIRDEVPAGTVLLSVSGTIGKVGIAGRPMRLNQAVMGMAFDETVIRPAYVYYYLQFYRPWLEMRANLVTIPNLTKRQLERVPILFPCLEEQDFLISVLERCERMGEEQNKALPVLEEAMAGAFLGKLEESGAYGWEPLGKCLEERIAIGAFGQSAEGGRRLPYVNALAEDGWGLNGSAYEPVPVRTASEWTQDGLNQGDLLYERLPKNGIRRVQLVREGMEDAVFGSALLRIRAKKELLCPQFLLLWLWFRERYMGQGGGAKQREVTSGNPALMDIKQVEEIPVPMMDMAVQKKLAGAVERMMNLQERLGEMAGLSERFYQSVLYSAFTGELSKRFRERKGLEKPDPALFQRVYRAAFVPVQEKEPESREIQGLIGNLGAAREQLLNYLSDFQLGILRAFAQDGGPLPVHAALKRAGRAGGSIQDALIGAKALEGMGFLEKTYPERVLLQGEPAADFLNRPVTIQKYQVISDEREDV